MPPPQQATPPALNEKQQQKLEKKIEKVKAKVDKKVSQSGKQIQQNDLSTIQHKHRFSSSDNDDLLYVIIAILLPPLAVYLYEDDITNHFWIDLLLTILFW